VDIVHIELKGAYGINQIRMPVLHIITGHNNDNMGPKEKGAAFSPGQEKVDNYAQHTICRHAAVDAAVGEEKDGEHDIPQESQGDPGPNLIQIKTVACKKKDDNTKKYGGHDKQDHGARLFYEAGDGARNRRGQAKGAYHV
jgi:hypothetical protein